MRKIRNFELSYLLATDPETRQHFIFSSWGVKLLIIISKSLSFQTLPYLSLVDDVILRSSRSVFKDYEHRNIVSVCTRNTGFFVRSYGSMDEYIAKKAANNFL